MILARVVGTIVATRKDPRLEGFKLLILRPVAPDGKEESGYLVAVDTVQAGAAELVIVVSGSSARLAEGCKDRPVDASIVGIVDEVVPKSVLLDVARQRARELAAGTLRIERHRRPTLMNPELIATLCDHAQGNPRALMNMAGELLAAAAERDARQIDEKLFFETCAVSPAAETRAAAGRRR